MADHVVVKDPDSQNVNYSLYWHEFLAGDTISSSAWTVDGSDGNSPLSLTVASDSVDTYTGQSPNLPNSQTTVRLSGGVAGYSYVVTNRITTVGGMVADDSILVRCWEK